MDFLKYLDVLIGLTIVMILLSPAVTAFTQLVLFALNSRSKFLRKGLTALIRQLDAPPIEKFAVTVPGKAPVGLPDPKFAMSQESRNATKLNILLRDNQGIPLDKHVVTLTRIPQGAQEGTRVETDPTDANGVARVTYLHVGSKNYAANTAAVSVLDPAGKLVSAANVACVIKTGPDANTNALLVGKSFEYPVATRPAPVQYQIECTVTNSGPLQNHKVRFDFDRNNSFDEISTAETRPDGKAILNLPPGVDGEVAVALADAVLRHPMICKVGFNLGWLRRLRNLVNNYPRLSEKLRIFDEWISRNPSGEVVQRDELTCILLELAAGEGAGGLKDPKIREALIRCLRMNGMANPSKALSDIRDEAQRLEKEQPNTAAHVRAAQAIITAAQSDYVGHINGWFDQTMDRTSQRYGMQARLVTILGALIVSFAIQVDSLDLLRRLSVDDKLRKSLLDEATMQQGRIDQLSKIQGNAKDNQDDMESARASRDEISQNLSKLRTPQLAILPDHFIWQRVPQAVLVRNPTWRVPPSKLELVLGSVSYTVHPRWRRDPLLDLREAIDALSVPVSTKITTGEDSVVVTAKNAGEVDLMDASSKSLLTPVVALTRAHLTNNPALPEKVNTDSCLVLDDQQQLGVKVTASKREDLIPNLQKAVKASSGVTAVSNGTQTELLITALDPKTMDIRLLLDCHDPFSNILSTSERITQSGIISKKSLGEQKQLQLKTDSRGIVPIKNLEEADYVDVKPHRPDSLILISRRLGPLELRHTVGKPETNILTEPIKADWNTIAWLLQPTLWGIVFTWLLLSLGASFWYDALKDLLKLRSSLASKEEAQRTDRQADTTPSTAAAVAVARK
jgi:hypothetical protein